MLRDYRVIIVESDSVRNGEGLYASQVDYRVLIGVSSACIDPELSQGFTYIPLLYLKETLA